jgi:NAD dependent epimerase/dehydratase family/TAF6 C-terminal HEAT repeat domain
MGEGTAALVVGAIGIVGTLVSALLTYRQADLARRAERDHSDARSAERERREAREVRAAQYAELNVTARQFLTAQSDFCHALRLDAGRVPAAESLDAARTAYRNAYAQAQMTVSATVLDALRTANRTLGTLYGALMRLASDPSVPGASERVEEGVRLGWAHLTELRTSLRADLGLGASAHGDNG